MSTQTAPEAQWRQNLRQLATHLLLARDPTVFDMSTFFQPLGTDRHATSRVPAAEEYECGTSACALGHGPLAGILRDSRHELWDDYASRCFLPPHDPSLFGYTGRWLFGGGWPRSGDQTTDRGDAALRILYYLDHDPDVVRHFEPAIVFYRSARSIVRSWWKKQLEEAQA